MLRPNCWTKSGKNSGEGLKNFRYAYQGELTRPSFCTTANERVYITAEGCEIEFGGSRLL